MSSENPYRPPQELAEEPVSDSEPSAPVLAVDDGNLLIVSDGVVLPKRCVFTNSVNNLKWRRERRVWNGTAKRLVLKFASFEMTYWQRKTSWPTDGIVFCLLTLALIASWFIFEPSDVLIGIVVVTVIGFMNHKRLEVVDYNDGHFWIKGCCKKFLDEVRRDTT